jgi:hypothetical protein
MSSQTEAKPQGWRLLDFTPTDLRVLVKLAAFLVVWKLLSTDYTALSQLIRGAPTTALPYPLSRLSSLLPSVLGKPKLLILLRSLAVGMLTLSLFRLRRPVLLAGIVPVLFIEWGAYTCRGTLYQLDLPLALLTITALYPARLSALDAKAARPESSEERSLRILGLLLVVYLAQVYFITGLSKLLYDRQWYRHVGLEYLYPFACLSYLGEPPGPFRELAYRLNVLLARSPWLGQGLAVLTLAAELGWPLVLVSRRARRLIPLAMLAVHAGIFLSGGPIFLSMAVLQAAVAVDWARVSAGMGKVLPFLRRGREGQESEALDYRPPRRAGWALAAIGLAAVSFAAVYPAVSAKQLFPFSNYNNFGWSYKRLMTGSRVTHALGYLDADTNTVKPLPPNQGGFLDFRHVAGTSYLAGIVCESADPALRRSHELLLTRFQTAIRPDRSNAKYLGPLAYPNNMLLASHRVEPAALQRLYLLRGVWSLEANRLIIRWQVCGSLPSSSPPVSAGSGQAPEPPGSQTVFEIADLSGGDQH